jgi:uncharacterized protein (DUF2267 family)
MGYREMVKTVQRYSGFSDHESESALHTFLRVLSRRLTSDEREDLASQLPAELQDDALQTEETDKMQMEDLMQEMADELEVDESRAKKQIMAAWNTLKDAVTPGEIQHIRSQMPQSMTAVLR